MATSFKTFSFPLPAGDIDPISYTLATHERDGAREIYATCTNPGQLQNQTFRLTVRGDKAQLDAEPIDRRNGVIITSSFVNPNAGKNEIWRMVRDGVTPSAQCSLEVYDAGSRTHAPLGPRQIVSSFSGFAFTLDKAYALATFDGVQFVGFEQESRTQVHCPNDSFHGDQPALIWTPTVYGGAFAGKTVWQASRQRTMKVTQTISSQQPLAGGIKKTEWAFTPPLPPDPHVAWVGQDPKQPFLWGLCAPAPQASTIQIIKFDISRDTFLGVVEAPFAHYEGAISPCANPVSGVLQFIDPVSDGIIAVDVNAATADRLAQSPISSNGAAMICDSAGTTWVAGNHPQYGPMLWGYSPA